ncbi:MAG: zf-TFIIB domain-containing protein [Maritimibacter sp.]|nr:zf-TFIIB domain-containing protein [Maritimibacter sp.]
MKCPACDTQMDEHLRHGVRIDHCPTCGGVWLDKGELDHLIAAVRPSVVLPDPDPHPDPGPARAPEPERRVSKPTPVTQPEPADRPRGQRGPEPEPDKTRRGPGHAHRYGRRYSNKARFKDLLEEIFDFD